MELRDVDSVRLAGAVNRRGAFIVIGALLALRAVMAAVLPLTADEAYYLLWSKHLAAGYYDHPPAIAWLIRAGTWLFGDTPLGIRASGIPLSVIASWFVWQTAALVLKDDRKAALAAIFFNLTLMANVEMLAATPDLPSIVTVAAYLWCLCKIQQSGDGRWWLAAGAAAGLSLLSKYSMLFVGLGTLVWLLADPRARPWLRRPWPYLGGALAMLIFAPNLVWQAQHQWMTFAFQFGRIGHGGLTGRYLVEFIGAQLGLATPLILVLAAIGFWRARRPGTDAFPLFVIVTVALLYFLQHALHDRVQGNWPAFIYPALAVFAADAMASSSEAAGHKKNLAPHWLARAAAPLAGVMLLAVYAQAAFTILPNDPSAHLLAKGFPRAVQVLDETLHPAAVITTDYETTALLRYYRPGWRVIQINEPWRYSWAGEGKLPVGTLAYLGDSRREQPELIAQYFRSMSLPPTVDLDAPYGSYVLQGPKTGLLGRMP